MANINDLKQCYACKSTTLAPAFASEAHSHNSLNRLGKDLPPGIDPAFLKVFNKVHWNICKYCGLIFAGLRPAGAGSSAWYLPLFKHSEERGYDAFPLPETYVSSKAKINARLYEIITARGLVRQGARLLQVRCATGELLRLAKQDLDADVWGLDFFSSCVAHANAILGETRVAQMTEPEPHNPFPQKKFDVIISNHMITHAHEPEALLGRFREWLCDDGVLIVHNEPDHQLTLKSFKAYPRGINFFHKQLFTEATFMSSMRCWGFDPERIRVTGNDARKFKKNMMFVCRKQKPINAVKGDWKAGARLLRGWGTRRRIAKFLRLV